MFHFRLTTVKPARMARQRGRKAFLMQVETIRVEGRGERERERERETCTLKMPRSFQYSKACAVSFSFFSILFFPCIFTDRERERRKCPGKQVFWQLARRCAFLLSFRRKYPRFLSLSLSPTLIPCPVVFLSVPHTHTQGITKEARAREIYK